MQEPDGTLLDHTAAVYFSSLSEPNAHQTTDLPIVLAGRASGALTPGNHQAYPPGTPVANLWLTLAHAMGVPIDALGQYSSGTLSGL